MDIITSKDNSTIKQVKKLKEKKYRNKYNKFLVEGFRFVKEAVLSSFEVEQIFIKEEMKNKWDNFSIDLKLENSNVVSVSSDVFKILSNTDNPQGIIAVVKNNIINIKDKRGFYILADKIQDPGNMGTIIRTAHASGALGVIITKGTVDIYNDKTLRSTMGSIFNIPVIEDEGLQILQDLKGKGYEIVGSYLDDSSIGFYKADFKDKLVLVVGNEGNGISKEVISLCDKKVKIPMPGGTESLNAAVAASIMMYEIVRRNCL